MSKLVVTVARPIVRFLQQIKVTHLTNDPGNEMIRVGVGRNKTRPFARVDLWDIGVRLS